MSGRTNGSKLFVCCFAKQAEYCSSNKLIKQLCVAPCRLAWLTTWHQLCFLPVWHWQVKHFASWCSNGYRLVTNAFDESRFCSVWGKQVSEEEWNHVDTSEVEHAPEPPNLRGSIPSTVTFAFTGASQCQCDTGHWGCVLRCASSYLNIDRASAPPNPAVLNPVPPLAQRGTESPAYVWVRVTISYCMKGGLLFFLALQ